MNKKSEEAYISLFKYLDENIFKLNAATFMTDYETAMRNALKLIYPNSKLYGCWFHFCQAVRRHLIIQKRSVLLPFIRNNKNASLIYHKLLALPLLPAKSIPVMFEALKLQAQTFDSEKLFNKFFNYYEKQWIQKVHKNIITIFLQIIIKL